MATNEFIGFASNGSANIMSQADYAAAMEQGDGVQPGMASSRLANKIWRQGANMAAVLGQMIADAGYNALDNGDLAALKTSLYGGMSARIMAEFESGTFTPTLFGATVAGAFTYTIQVGNYLKIGSLCFVDLSIAAKVVTVPTGNAQIGGFPFYASSAAQSLLLNISNIPSGLNNAPFMCRVPTSGAGFIWGVDTASNYTAVSKFASDLAVDTQLNFRFSGIYRTA